MSVQQPDIGQIDKKLSIAECVNEPDIKYYDVRTTSQIDIYGLYNPREEKTYRRMPDDAAQSVSKSVGILSTYTAGGRLRFRFAAV